MGTSSTRAKRKYNEKNYVQLNVRIKPELKARLDELKGDGSYSAMLEKALNALDGGLEAENLELKEKLAKAKKLARRYKAELEEEKSKGFWDVLKDRILG